MIYIIMMLFFSPPKKSLLSVHAGLFIKCIPGHSGFDLLFSLPLWVMTMVKTLTMKIALHATTWERRGQSRFLYKRWAHPQLISDELLVLKLRSMFFFLISKSINWHIDLNLRTHFIDIAASTETNCIPTLQIHIE